MTTALKYHHYFIIKIIKSSKDVWNITKTLNIFNARKQTIVVKTTFVIIFQIYVVMTSFFSYYIHMAYQNIHFWSGSSKNAIFFKFDHFSRSMWTSNSGHEYEKFCHKYPMVLFGTTALWYKNIHLLGQEVWL